MSKFDRKEIYIRNNYWKRKKISPRKKFFSLFWTILFSRLKRPLTHISVFLISSTFRENIFFRMKILFRSMNHGKFFFFQFPLFFVVACVWLTTSSLLEKKVLTPLSTSLSCNSSLSLVYARY